MPYVCKDCDNKENFYQRTTGRCYYSCVNYLNAYGEIEERNDVDCDEYDDNDLEDMECSKCGGQNVEEVDDLTWENHGEEHEEEEEVNWKTHLEQRRNTNI